MWSKKNDVLQGAPTVVGKLKGVIQKKKTLKVFLRQGREEQIYSVELFYREVGFLSLGDAEGIDIIE